MTCRQTERTFGLVADALGKDPPDGLTSAALQRICDDLLEASVPEEFKDASTSLAVDWTDLESFSRPPPHGTRDCADPEASWGHRKNNLPRSQDELFYGYYFSAAIMMPDEAAPAVPELARRATLSSCRHDPVRALAPVLTAMPGQHIPLGDILADSGYAHRDADAWALPLRQAGAQLVQDLHPHDRGPKGTHHGAVIANGNLYCPQTPRPLLEPGPLARTATRDQAAGHDRPTAKLARYKLGRLTSDDADGYHRVQCPAAMGKIRCPLRLTGPAPLMLFTTTLLIARNQRILDARNTRQQENARRAAAGLPPKPGAAAARHPPRSPQPPSRRRPAKNATQETAAGNRQECQTRVQQSGQRPNVNKAPTET